MHNYKKLNVWNRSMNFVIEVYKATQLFPKEEMYGLSQQLRRCAVSIPSNIAEGCGRNTPRDIDHFFAISLGSSFEMETQLLVASNLSYMSNDTFTNLNNELTQIQKMLVTLKKTITSK